eukprot:COSAG06_NODE_23388_length_693_cov_0.936027_1_plen_21_part_01
MVLVVVGADPVVATDLGVAAL